MAATYRIVMKFEERHLAQLAAVVEAGGVTEGAALVGLSQPAVSRTLSTMEKRLGEPLFLAGRRPLIPTLIGLQLAAHCKVILEASRKASELPKTFSAALWALCGSVASHFSWTPSSAG